MQRNILCVLVLGLAIGTQAFAQNASPVNAGKVVYKWSDKGVIYYSHIKPINITKFERLDKQGRIITDTDTEGFGELVEIVRPNLDKPADAANPTNEHDSEMSKALALQQQDELKKRNCATAKQNLNILNSGEVYEPDAQGNMTRLSAEQIEAKRVNVNRDVDYFCN